MTPEERQHGWTYEKRVAAGWMPYVGLYDAHDNTWRGAGGVWLEATDPMLKRERHQSWQACVSFHRQMYFSVVLSPIQPRLFWVRRKTRTIQLSDRIGMFLNNAASTGESWNDIARHVIDIVKTFHQIP